MKMAEINIFFENSRKFYFEGEKVQVKLEVNVDKSCTLTNIVANFIGLSSCIKSNESSKKNVTRKIFHKNLSEIHFDDIVPLFVAQNKEASVWLPGIQVLTLEYQLPSSLPTSVESTQGFVRYSVIVMAELNGEILKKTEHFTVVAKTDVNNDVTAHLPGVLWKYENQCFLQDLFCKSGSIRAFMHIAKRGFVPGECIFINAEICNFHRLPIEWVKATLVQILKFHGPKVITNKRVVAEVTRGCVLPADTQTWRSESMLIPAIPPSSFSPKKLVHVKYKLLFQMKPSWQRKAAELKQKIIIGAVKLVESGLEEEGQGEGEGPFSSESFNCSNLEPCIFGPHIIEEDGKSSTFSPLYPMYVVM